MASNLVVARGGVEHVPPISLAFWRWSTVFFLLILFNYKIFNKKRILLKEYKELFFLGLMGCGVCGAFPFIAGQTTTIINMGIIICSAIGGIILFKEQLSKSNWGGIFLALIAISMITFSSFLTF